MTPERRRILLVRLDGLGDALACIPALEGLRRAYPDARFGALCSPANAALYSNQRVARIHVYSGGAPQTLVSELRSEAYTDAIVATEEPIGYQLARMSGAPRRAGFWHRFEKTFKSLWQYVQLTDAVYRPAAWVNEPEHEVAALYRLALRIGATRPIPDDPRSLRPWIDIDETEGTHGNPPPAAFQITAKIAAGGWDAPALASLIATALAASPFERAVLLCAAADEGLARAVMEHLEEGAQRPGAIIFLPPMRMASWLGSIASAGALVSPDTGAAHAAGMLGVPVVDLFEPERFAQLSQQWRPWAAPSRCLVKPAFHAGAAAAFGAELGAALTEVSRAKRAAS